MATYGHGRPPSLRPRMNRCAAGGSCTGSPGWRRRRRWTTSSATTWSAGGWNPAPGLDQRRAWHSAMTGSLDTWGPSRRCRGPVRLPADVTSRRRAICPRTKIRLDARADLRRPGSWSSATVPVAGWGAREGVGAHKSPRRVCPGRVAAVTPTMGWTRSGDHAAWPWSWRWSRVVQLRRPIRFGGSGLRPQRGRGT
jgi:hypothetical protein